MVIVILIMTLLTLIVISMTKNANREQRQALDRQLNSQAFYAAESGINDARDYYLKHFDDPTPASEIKSDCSGIDGATGGNQFPSYSSQVGANSVNSYSCVLYDATPPSLDFSDVGTNTSVIMPLQDKDNQNIKSLTFTWKRPNNASYDFSGCPSSGFPKSLNNCDAGALRVELIDPIATTRDEFIQKDFVSFIAPSSSAAGVTESYTDGITGASYQGVSWKGGCSGGANGKCTITIDNINHDKLVLHLRSVYNENEVKVTGKKLVSGVLKDVEFKDAQMMIDSTGKASDILKRIQVRVPLTDYGNGVYPEFSLQTADSICKLLQIIPPGFADAQSSVDSSCGL